MTLKKQSVNVKTYIARRSLDKALYEVDNSDMP
jgi:hypothetical protein